MANNEIFRHVKESSKEITKKSTIDSIKELLKTASKSRNNDIISYFTRKFIKRFLHKL